MSLVSSQTKSSCLSLWSSRTVNLQTVFPLHLVTQGVMETPCNGNTFLISQRRREIKKIIVLIFIKLVLVSALVDSRFCAAVRYKGSTLKSKRLFDEPLFSSCLLNFNLILSVRPARYKVAITKHKDSEQTSSSLYSQNNMWAPAVDFSKYINDNESIDNQVRIFRRKPDEVECSC